jgi:hypothetical protein
MRKRRREDNIKIDSNGFCLMDWMILAQDMNHWRVSARIS